MMKRLVIGSVMALVATVFAVSMFGGNTTVANADDGTISVVVGRGVVATENSDVRGFRFRLRARVNENGDARGRFEARVHVRGDDSARRIIGIRARFNEGAIEGNHAKLAGKAKIRLANGEVRTGVPFKLGVEVTGRGEYTMVLVIGDRVLEGKGVRGNVRIFEVEHDKIATVDGLRDQ